MGHHLTTAFFAISLLLVISYSSAASTTPLLVNDITSVSSSNAGGNSPRNLNYGISLWYGVSGSSTGTEYGHLSDSNVWDDRNAGQGYLAVGAADSIGEQTLTVQTDRGQITISTPALSSVNGNMRLYVSTDGSTYHCNSNHDYTSLNPCNMDVTTTMTSSHLAKAGSSSDQIKPLIRNPSGSGTGSTASVNGTSVTISWNTDEPASSIIEYGTSTSYGSQTSDTSLALLRSFIIDNLNPSTTYYYKAKAKDVAGNEETYASTFQTGTVDNPPSITSVSALPSPRYHGLAFTLSAKITDDIKLSSASWSTAGTSGTVYVNLCTNQKDCSYSTQVQLPDAGFYTITFTATDSGGKTTTATTTITINACTADSQCDAGRICSLGKCILGTPSSTYTPVPSNNTTTQSSCAKPYDLGCSTETLCRGVGGYWCPVSQNSYGCQQSSCPGCTSATPWACFTEQECKSNGLNWCYSQVAGSLPWCSNSGCSVAQQPNATSDPPTLPLPPASSLPVPTYIPPERPSVFCNTDQDCSWLITNSCPESAGATWICSSLLGSLEKTRGVCPNIFSPRPSANCGCVQNTCVIFQKEKPKEPPKKIGNTSVDATSLLATVIQIEQLKVKFDFLKSVTIKLSEYYNLTGKTESSSKWSKASAILENVIKKIDFLKDNIRLKLSDFTVDDLRQVKREMKTIIGTIKDVVKAVL